MARRAWLPATLVLVAASCAEEPLSGACEADADCAADSTCRDGLCVEDPVPRVTLVADRAAARLGAEVALDGGASYLPGGGTLSYSWSVAPEGAATVTADEALPSQAKLRVLRPHQDLTVTLVATSPTGRTASAEAAIASENAPPTARLDGPAVPPQPGEEVALSVVAEDLDGDALAYEWSVTPAATLVDDGGAARLTPDAAVASATYRIEVAVSDGVGGRAVATLELSAENVAPALEPPANGSEDHHCGQSSCDAAFLVAPAATDVQAVTLSYRLAQAPFPEVTLAAEPADGGDRLVLHREAFGPISGGYVVEVTATDALGLSSSATFELVVRNRPPVLRAHDGRPLPHVYDPALAAGGFGPYHAERAPGGFGVFSDPDGDVLERSTIRWQSASAHVRFDDPTTLDPHVEVGGALEDLPGLFVQFTASDPNGAAGASTELLTLANEPPVVTIADDLADGHEYFEDAAGAPRLRRELAAANLAVVDPEGDPVSSFARLDDPDGSLAAAGIVPSEGVAAPVVIGPLEAVGRDVPLVVVADDELGGRGEGRGLVRVTNRAPVVTETVPELELLARNCGDEECCVLQVCSSRRVARGSVGAAAAGAAERRAVLGVFDPDGDPLSSTWTVDAAVETSAHFSDLGVSLGSPAVLPCGAASCGVDLVMPALHTFSVGPVTHTCSIEEGSNLGSSVTASVEVADPLGATVPDTFTWNVVDDFMDPSCP